jgi:ABC-type transport system substrate-binding protein
MGILVVLALVFSGLLAGCSSPASTSSSSTPATTPMTITYSGNPQTIDPRNIYDGEDWNIGRAMYVGLYDLQAGGQLVPCIAAGMPQISNDGTVYTIKISPTAMWSNGQPVKAQDFVYSLRSELAPGFNSPNDYLWYMVKGAADFEAGKSQSLGVQAIDDSTVQYTLSQPFTAFTYVLSTPAAFPVCQAAASQVSTSPVTEGPYTLKSWTKGVSLTLVKNLQWKQSAPYPDSLVFDFNVDQSVGIMRVQNGQADLDGDGIPPANYLQLIANPQTKSQITAGTIPAVILLCLNTQVKPFDNLKVRQAIEYAINKPHLMQLLNNRGAAATSILPRALPGFANDTYNPYPYDPAKAKALLTEAGYPNGFSTTLGSAAEETAGDAIVSEVKNDLQAIGISVTAEPLPQDATAIAQMPMTTFSWYMDYPDPCDFIDGFVTSPAVTGGSNMAFLSDPVVAKEASQADQMANGPARVQLYEKIDAGAMQDAGYVPLFYPELTFFHSARVKGYRITSYFPCVYNELWLAQ